MTTSDESRGFSLRRWSQRKLAAARVAERPGETAPQVDATASPVPSPAQASPTLPASPAQPDDPTVAPAALPPVESLTIDSDFTAFLQPEVDEGLKREALKALFRDPRFNVMDGLDVYVDDYSRPDPISPEIVRQLVQARYIFDPPATRVNAQGNVEDVPEEERAQARSLTDPVQEAPAPALPDPAEPASAVLASAKPASAEPASAGPASSGRIDA